MGNIKDYATSLIATAPSPASSGTSLVVTAGHGSRFPATPFSATLHPANEIPTLDNSEKVLVTNVTTDTLTVTRAQGDTTAKNIADGWRITNALFKQDLDEKEYKAKVTPIGVSVTTGASTAAKVGTTSGGSYIPATGDIIVVSFTASNTANSPTLNIDGSGAKSIFLGNFNPTAVGLAGTKVMMWYDGTAYQLFGSQRTSDTNTSYTGITSSAAVTTTATKTLAINSLDLANYASGQLVYTLPGTAAVGSIIEVYAMNTGGWRVNAPSGDNIIMEDGHDSGAAGYIFGGKYTWVQLRCTVANATWVVTSSSGVLESGTGNKTPSSRINPRVSSAASASSLTPTIADFDQYCYTALAADLTINAPTGTPVNGNKLMFRIKDDGTTRTLTWNAIFRGVGVTLPTATTVSKTHYVGAVYNAADTKWDVIAVATEA